MDNVFSYFIKSCDECLGFLVQKYSYNMNEPDIMPPECLIEYRKEGIILNVIYEYGDFPWIRVTINGKDNSLDNIIKKKYPEYWINRKKVLKMLMKKLTLC